jgi:hypothetical protein
VAVSVLCGQAKEGRERERERERESDLGYQEREERGERDE